MRRSTVSAIVHAGIGALMAGVAASALAQAVQQTPPADHSEILKALPAWLNPVLSGGLGGVLWGVYGKISAFLAAYEARAVADDARHKAANERMDRFEAALGRLPCHRPVSDDSEEPSCRAGDDPCEDYTPHRRRGRS